MKIAVDFDGTCVKHEFPLIGEDIGAIPILRQLVKEGHELFLFTMRSDDHVKGQNYLSDAVNWFKRNGIKLAGVQQDPEQFSWTSSPKCFANLYIDDAALGIPLIVGPGRPFVDWLMVLKLLIKRRVITDLNFFNEYQSGGL